MFHVGQKVKCIDDSLDPGLITWKGLMVRKSLDGLKKGSVYTVRELTTSWMDDKPAVKLVEIVRPEDTLGESPYWVHRFRPIIEHKTDISIFKEMLNPANHHDLCDNND